MTTIAVDLRSRILQTLPRDNFYQEVKAEIVSGRPLVSRFEGYVLESDGLLRHASQIYVPPLDDLHLLILSEAHCAPYSIH